MIAFHQAQRLCSLDEHLDHAIGQLKSHGFNRYYNAMVGTYLSKVAQALRYPEFANATQRATQPLTSNEQAVMYSTLYAKAHFERFGFALKQLLGTHKRTEAQTMTIHVIDYGCGQALASLAFIDYLQQFVNCEQITLQLHLVEPSQTTLTLAARAVTAMASRISATTYVHEHHGSLADFLQNSSLNVADEDCVLHLLSNVLDIAAVQTQIPTLAEQIAATAGKQLILGVGPNYSNHTQGLELLKRALTGVRVKQDVAKFAVASEIYSIKNHHWEQTRAVGTMMGLCYHNAAQDEPLPKAA